ncbi:unnamed protein product [Aphanomyces euteiches]|uniref:Chromatin modification-related protein MEAF6 n=1 Tax=Aphanomyces euteiches TaxID=100861 RepID=A0A6G0X888_9STRA|nr:hypothetical protein Ae201684_007242 [Aphanomyces euteiches]KAH9100507.1 hypothetical protein Ae201684P_006704 [Aphanomyces euteiches]KAH9155774.1 hypothetical protein AeRB84_002271 [Aphanomyces euteiches]
MSTTPDSPATPAPTTPAPKPTTLSVGSTADGLKALQEAQRKLEEGLAKIEAQIRESEASYLEDTAHGNIIRGWEGYADLKGKKDALLKKVKPYTDNEKLFSNSSVGLSKNSSHHADDDTGTHADGGDMGDEPRRKKKDGRTPKVVPGKTPKKVKKRKLTEGEDDEDDDGIGMQ